MGGTREGGRKSAQKIKARDPHFYAKIGHIGGQRGHDGGFYATAQMPCECRGPIRHMNKAACAGSKGGAISKRRAVPIR